MGVRQKDFWLKKHQKQHGSMQTLPAPHVTVVYSATWLRSSKAKVWGAILVSFMLSCNDDGLVDHNKKSAVLTNQRSELAPIDQDQRSRLVHVYPKPDLCNLIWKESKKRTTFFRAYQQHKPSFLIFVLQPWLVEKYQNPQGGTMGILWTDYLSW